MNRRDPRVKCLRSVLLGVALLGQIACLAPSRLIAFRPGDAVPEGSVVLVGRLMMDPQVDVDTGPALDVGGYLGKINLLFTDTPRSPLTQASQANFMAQAPQGKLLVVIAPRRTLFVRGLHIVASISGGGYTPFGQARAPVTSSVQCWTNLTIEPQPEDQVIYIGALYCHHQKPTPELRVYDEWKDIEPQLRNYTDTSHV